ncbi:TPA: hypothetical protein ACGO80_002234, partial [Streptococcus suis]
MLLLKKLNKKVLTNTQCDDRINELSKQAKKTRARNRKYFKKVLTRLNEDDRIIELSNLRHNTEKRN